MAAVLMLSGCSKGVDGSHGQCVHIRRQCMTDAHTLPSSGFGGGSHFKVDLAQIDVGADDGDHHLVAEAPGLAGSGVGQADALGQAGAGGSQAGGRRQFCR